MVVRLIHRRASHIKACTSHTFTSLPCAQDTGGETPYIGTKGCFEASDCWRLGRQAADHPWSALRVVESCRKDCPTASVLLEAKAAALHPKRYQSSLSKLSTIDCLVKKPCGKKSAIAIYQRGRVRRGKEAQANGFASQSDRQKSGQIGDRQTD